MKTVLVVAGLLMTGASVYGIVDYNKNSEKKEFKQLYKERPVPVEKEVMKEEVLAPVVEKKETSKTEALPVPEKTTVKKAVKKKLAKKGREERKFSTKAFSRSRLG